MKKATLVIALGVALLHLDAWAQEKMPGFVLIPAGQFEMGDHHNYVDPQHPSDEIPIHNVRVDSFYMGITVVTTQEYCQFLNAAVTQKSIEVRQDGVQQLGHLAGIGGSG